MIEIVLTLMTSALSFQFFGQSFEWDRPERFDPKIVRVHIPQAFDYDDVAQVVAEIKFENTCENLGPTAVFPHEEFPNVLLLHVEGYRRVPQDPEKECKDIPNYIPVPIDIGVLDPREYELRNFKKIDQKLGTLRVRAKKNRRIDDLTYAPVDSLVIRKDVDGFRRFFSLAGTFSDNCSYFDAEKFKIAKTAEAMIEILPAITKLDHEDCRIGQFPFFETFEIPSDREGPYKIGSGRYLFHVRSMNGQAFNKIDTIVLPEN